MDSIRIGVLGTGNIADLNVAGYLEDPRCEVLAVCDVVPSSAAAAAQRWACRGSTTTSTSSSQTPTSTLSRCSPDAPAPRARPRRPGGGKHVSVQKPVANTIEEAIEMGKAAENAGLTLRISECMAHYPPLELAKSLVAEGAIGKPIGLRIRTVVGQTDSSFQTGLNPDGYGWRLDDRSPGGHLFDDMVHKYAMALWLLEKDITSVQAVVRRRDLFFEPCAAIFEYEDPELLGTMEVQYAPHMWLRTSYYGADEFFEIQGEEGFLWVTRATGEMLDLAPVVLYSGRDKDITTTEFNDLDSSFLTGFKRSSAHFIDALLNGTAASLTPEEAVKVLQLCFAVYLAGETHEAVDPGS